MEELKDLFQGKKRKHSRSAGADEIRSFKTKFVRYYMFDFVLLFKIKKIRLMRIVIMLFVGLISTIVFAQAPKVDFLGQLSYTNKLSDVWGFEKCGKEYALVGVSNGVSIVDVTDPQNPQELFFESGAYTNWRDIKTWNNYAYVVNEGSGSLLIMDLSELPLSIETYNWTGGMYDGEMLTFNTAHNIFIDENGIAYLCGSDLTQGVFYLDLNSDPINPTILGGYQDNYVHDLFVRGDTMWTAEYFQGRIVAFDITDKENEIPLGLVNTPQNAAHNIWLSDDGKFMFTTDETSNGYIAAFNVEDPTNMFQVDSYYSNPGSGSIPHNTFVKGNYLVSSYYNDGVTVADISDPSAITQVDEYDTTTDAGYGFDGCWGVYPYLPSGIILATDINEGLFILGDINQSFGANSIIGNACDDADSNTENDVFVDEGCTCIGELPINVNNNFLNLKVFLQGTFEENFTGIPFMRNDLGEAGLIPLSEPYSDFAEFTHIDGGGETTDLSIINAPGNSAIVDWVFIELRSAETYEVVATKSALLKKDGIIVNTSGLSNLKFVVPDGQYYVAIRHRNHLGIMNANPIYLSGGPSIFIDFTKLTTSTYGEYAQVQIGSVKAMWAGNANLDSKIIYQGASNESNDIFFRVLQDMNNPSAYTNFITSGYFNQDINMDGNVIYQGQNNDTNYIFFNVLNAPNNTTLSSNFVINEQLP